jgi:hypothetical protein
MVKAYQSVAELPTAGRSRTTARTGGEADHSRAGAFTAEHLCAGIERLRRGRGVPKPDDPVQVFPRPGLPPGRSGVWLLPIRRQGLRGAPAVQAAAGRLAWTMSNWSSPSSSRTPCGTRPRP